MPRRLLAAAVLLVATSAFAKGGDALSLIPTDAVSVGVVRLAQLRTSPLSSALFQQTDKMSVDGDAEKFLREAGLSPAKDIDLVVVSASPRTNLGTDARVLVAAEGRFNVDRLSAALVARGAERIRTENGSYFILPESHRDADENGAVSFVDSSLVVAGTESAVAQALQTRAAGGSAFAAASGLGHDMNRIDRNASAWALVDVARASRIAGAGNLHSDRNPAFNMAIKNLSTVGLWATDTGDALKLGAFGLSGDEETLQLMEDTLRGALSALRLAAQDNQPDLVAVLRKFSVSRSNDAVTINGTIPAESVREFLDKQQKRRDIAQAQ
jgi:hypothetical protein